MWLGQRLPLYRPFPVAWQMSARPCVPFPAPPHQTVRAIFPHTAFGVPLTQGMHDRLAWPLGAVLPGVSARKGVLAVRLDNHAALSSVSDAEQPGSLRSTGVTPLHRYYEPLRLLPRPMTVFGFSLMRSGCGAATPAPRQVSRVALTFCHDVPSRRPRRSPRTAHACCFVRGFPPSPILQRLGLRGD